MKRKAKEKVVYKSNHDVMGKTEKSSETSCHITP